MSLRGTVSIISVDVRDVDEDDDIAMPSGITGSSTWFTELMLLISRLFPTKESSRAAKKAIAIFSIGDIVSSDNA